MGYNTSISLTKELSEQWEELPKFERSRIVQKLLTDYFEDRKPTKQKAEPTEAIKQFYDLYVDQFGANKNTYKLTPARISKLKSRLSDAGEEMLRLAINNTANSKFHRGENDRGWKADLDWIIKSYEQVEKLAAMVPVEKPKVFF